MFKLLIISSIVGIASAQVLNVGECPKVETISSFDVERYSGRWYEQNRFFTIFEIGAKCVTADYTPNDNGIVKVVNTEIVPLLGTKRIEGTARIPNASEPGKLAVKFPLNPIEGSYWILDTDYTSYSAVWSCQDFFFSNTQFAWILTREENPPDSVIENAKNVFTRNGVDTHIFETTNQENCPANQTVNLSIRE